MRKVLNVGGNNRAIPLPSIYEEWVQLLLDIDPKGQPDVLCDARAMTDLPASTYDSVYCSHNLEHYHRHEVPKVLAGFRHVLKADGLEIGATAELFLTTSEISSESRWPPTSRHQAQLAQDSALSS